MKQINMNWNFIFKMHKFYRIICCKNYINNPINTGSRCGRADSVLDSHTTGSRPGWYGTLYWASDCWPPWQHQVERTLMCVEGRGRISRSGLTQDIKMGSCVFQCDVPHQWIAQRQVGPASVYCDGVGCHVLCLRHDISVCGSTLVKVPLLQAGTVAIWPQMFQSVVIQTNKQSIQQKRYCFPYQTYSYTIIWFLDQGHPEE